MESAENLNICDNAPLYINTKGSIAEAVIPITSGTDKAGDLKIEREERIDRISASSARTDSTNHPVWNSATVADL